jgi:small-conductance mechanosensitive channel
VPSPRQQPRLATFAGNAFAPTWWLAGLLWLAAAAWAQEPQEQRYFSNQLAALTLQFEQADTTLAQPGLSTSQIEALREELKNLKVRAQQLRTEAEASAADGSKLLQSLGPEPGEEDAPEEDPVAVQRSELRDRLTFYQGVGKQAGLLVTQADLAEGKIAKVLLARIAQQLWARDDSPLSAKVLGRAPADLVAALARLRRGPAEAFTPMFASRETKTQFAAFCGVLLFAVVLGWPVRRWLLRRFARDPSERQPSFSRRLKAAVAVSIARGFLPSLSALVVLGGFWLWADVMGPVAHLLVAAVLSFVFVAMVSALARAVLAPRESAWRCSSVGDVGARKLYKRLVALASVVAVKGAVAFVSRPHLNMSTELTVLFDFITNTVIALLVLSLLPARLWQPRRPQSAGAEAPAPGANKGYALLRLAIGLVAIGIPLSGLFGYHNLAQYLALGLARTAAIAGTFAVLHGLVKDAVALALGRGKTAATAFAETQTTDQSARMLSFWVVAVVDLLLALAAGVALLLAWGLQWAELKDWSREAFSGITVGTITLSFGSIFSAVLVFIAALAITRWLQRFLEKRVLPQTRLDVGARDALKSGLGYVGVVLGSLVAFSALGLDLSNLAIVAGALSVGIGFGLQNIVNNFVSGLILLIERPVKVGDWVVIGGQEGYVKRINVRATEIQTFQRASVIIPNSELLSTAVTNWTHKDTFGRVDIPVGVAYGSDTDRIREILLQCAREHPKANAWPAPQVLFRDFGASSLDFELRFHVDNVDQRLGIASEVRYAIDRAFREAGIEIPFQQTDIHFRDLEHVEKLLRSTAGAQATPERQPPSRPAPARKSL